MRVLIPVLNAVLPAGIAAAIALHYAAAGDYGSVWLLIAALTLGIPAGLLMGRLPRRAGWVVSIGLIVIGAILVLAFPGLTACGGGLVFGIAVGLRLDGVRGQFGGSAASKRS